MAGYLDQSLGANEDVLHRGAYPTVFWIGAWATLLLFGVFIVGLVLFVSWAVHMRTTQFAVTTDRVVLKRGWIRRSTDELSVDTVEAVEIEQGLFGRMFDYGRIRVRGTGEALIAFPPMQNPVAFRRAIENGRDHAQRARSADKPATVSAVEA